MRVPYLIASLLALVSCARSQIVYIDDSSTSSAGAYATPFVGGSGITTLQVYTAAQLRERGVCGGAVLGDIAVVPSSGTGVYLAPTARFQVGHLSVSPPVPGAWTTHLASPATIHAPGMGNYGFTTAPNTWVSLPAVSAAGFVWDGVRDLGLLYTASSGTVGGFYSRSSNANLLHAISVYNATTQLPTTVGNFAMKVRLTFQPGQSLYQTNQSQSSLDIDGIPGLPCTPSAVSKCAGSPGALNFSSSVNNGWELLISPAPLLPLGGGGIQFPPGGQILNVSLAPGIVFLNNLAFPPFPGNFTFPFTTPGAGVIGAQMLVLDPVDPSGFVLSAPARLNVISGGSLPGPTATTQWAVINLGTPPLCGPASLNFFGVSYTQISVSSAGRITFGGNSAIQSPSIGWATLSPGMVGHWCDLDPGAGGTVTVSAPASTLLRVDYVNVPYTAQPGTANTFGIEFDAVAGTIKLDNLAGIQAHPQAANAFLGISRGNGSTNTGQTLFLAGTNGTSGNGTRMLYSFGPCGTLTTGLNQLVFFPNQIGNYDWFAL